MYYEINVTTMIDGRLRHWFATAERSIRTEAGAKALADVFRQLPDAATVTVTKWETTGTETSL